MTDLRAQLTKDHLDLDALLQSLAEDATAPESGALQVTWSRFEKCLLAHIDAEERYLLPLVHTSHPSETARTRIEHARILDVVSALGIAVELHTARQPAIADLVTMLREHAEHEDRVLYPLGSSVAAATTMLDGAARPMPLLDTR